MASWHLSEACEGFSLCCVWVRADKSILMKYKYQRLLKQQRRDESSTWHLPQQDLLAKIMCWRKASAAIEPRQLDTRPPSMSALASATHLRTAPMSRSTFWHGVKPPEFRAPHTQLRCRLSTVPTEFQHLPLPRYCAGLHLSLARMFWITPVVTETWKVALFFREAERAATVGLPQHHVLPVAPRAAHLSGPISHL